ncbi:MAG: HD domain-containing protein [Chloroflexota bacterium]|nr:HD domain-containing protein [Chloroflexota bacterium]
MTTFAPPPALGALIDAIVASGNGTDPRAYVVGGTVRDVLMGREAHDLDLAVEGDAVAWARRLAEQLAGHFVLLDEVQAVARVVLDGGAVRHVDVARLQGSVEQDMRRRDLTIDALAVPLGNAAVIDVCGGVRDIAARVVRMNGTEVFDEDPLRLLRAARIASELEFEIEAGTAAAIRERAARVNEAAAERRRDELARIFSLDRAYPALRLLDGLGLLDALLPELTAGRGVTQPERFHAYDVFEHNIRAVEAMDTMLAPATDAGSMWRTLWETFAWCEGELRAYLAEEMSEGRGRAGLLKLAALLHDVAKPETRTEDADGRVRFFGHADAGAETARRIMRRLRFSSRESAFVSLLVAEHLRPVQLAEVGHVPTRRALYRFYRDLGDAAPEVLLLALADAAAARGAKMTQDEWSRQVRYMNSLLVRSKEEEGIVDSPRLLTGHDIMSEFGLSQGTAVGKALEALLEAQGAGELHDREGALAFVRRLLGEGKRRD